MNIAIPIEEHPLTIVILRWNYPLFSGLDNPRACSELDVTMPKGIDETLRHLWAIALRHYATGWAFENVASANYYRLAAKVAHGFVCVTLGVSAFEPVLTDFILGLEPLQDHFVGIHWDEQRCASQLHVVDLDYKLIRGRYLIICRVHLFCFLGLVPVALGVGWLNHGTPQTRASYREPIPEPMRGKISALPLG